MRGMLVGLIALTASAACLRQTEFHCTTDGECGGQGTCVQSVGFCSFPDPSCGSRFSDSAGPYANQCVGGADAGVDAPSRDAPGDVSPASCPPGYGAVAGLPHLYLVISAPNDWASQVSACASTSASAYLAIPDDLAELQALDSLAGPTVYWAGIDDLATVGVYVTVKNVAATFLPWAPGQPDNNPNSRCVAAISATAQLEDAKCNSQGVAICECEP